MNVKAHCTDLLDFHEWRQGRIIQLLRSLDSTFFEKELNGSFGSLLIVMNHLVWAEKVWYGRVDNNGIASMTDLNPEGLLKEWESITQKWKQVIASSGEEKFNMEIRYFTTQAEAYSNTMFEIIVHMVDHATYHVGQMMNAVRSFGVEPVSTNYIHFLRAKKEGKL